MAEEPAPPSWINLVLEILERLLPAFLIIWNNSLRQKNRELTVHLAHETMEKEVAVFKAEEAVANDKKASIDIIDDFLSLESDAQSSGATSRPRGAAKDALSNP